jgi:hypothetical protein
VCIIDEYRLFKIGLDPDLPAAAAVRDNVDAATCLQDSRSSRRIRPHNLYLDRTHLVLHIPYVPSTVNLKSRVSVSCQ